MSEARERLIELLKELSYERRKVVLASGRESDFYVDGKQTTLHAEGARLVGQLILEQIRALETPIDGVGGLTMGADPIATATSVLSSMDGGPLVHAFYVRKEAKGHGTKTYVEGRKNLPDGSRVIVVEDTSTTGGSAWKAVERCRNEGLNVVMLITVVNRLEGANEFIAERGMKLHSLVTLNDLTD
ncbi:MAG: orotate phosphoribosyltransferase [Rickettsiales bacterium]|mgnify:CR=1 FL=1|nr:orotate phosphoribosyltransferase [Rickettsiales bacterium]|tara:strand:- start:1031 stop:1588 length:558 start_codon:yes stop_codon:yes gene_type:complete